MIIGLYKRGLFDFFHLMKYSGENIANLFFTKLGEFEISKNIFTLSLDNASNDNIALVFIRNSFLCQGMDNLSH